MLKYCHVNALFSSSFLHISSLLFLNRQQSHVITGCFACISQRHHITIVFWLCSHLSMFSAWRSFFCCRIYTEYTSKLINRLNNAQHIVITKDNCVLWTDFNADERKQHLTVSEEIDGNYFEKRLLQSWSCFSRTFFFSFLLQIIVSKHCFPETTKFTPLVSVYDSCVQCGRQREWKEPIIPYDTQINCLV